MLEMEADGQAAPGSARWPAGMGPVTAPDREVLDSARSRLDAQRAAAGPGPLLRRSLEDIRAVDAVIQAVRHGAPRSPDLLDAGAALVLLCNLRLYLDRLEAGLLDTARQLQMSWDLIAAIMGRPAAVAADRRRALRSGPDPQ
ncbi:MAG: hypothetical protein ACHP9Z_32620 [Streptosporangiales bacterium]